MTFPDQLPKLCPGCGLPHAETWVSGWHGWVCGSYNASHVRHGAGERFIQSIDCAVLHWKTRALKSEAKVERAETNVRHWQEECGKLYYSKSTR